jgi:hypothetical protein
MDGTADGGLDIHKLYKEQKDAARRQAKSHSPWPFGASVVTLMGCHRSQKQPLVESWSESFSCPLG